MVLRGQLFELQSSDFTECEMAVAEKEVAFIDPSDGTVLYKCSRNSLRIEPRIGSVAQKIELPNGRVFATEDFDSVKSLKPGGFWNFVSNTERPGWHLIPLAIATPFLAYGLYRLMIPVLISMAMAVTPDGLLRTMDKNAISTLDTVIMEPTTLSDERQAEITELFEELLIAKDESLGALSDRELEYKLLFRDAERIGPNAFALPGGTIVLTDERVEMFDEDYVIAAVLAHEIGHIDNEHQLQQLYRALGMAALISVIAGDAGAILEDALLEGSAILSLSYSREHESESDSYSYELLKAADIRTDGLILFFDRLEEDYSIPKAGEWMMSHPVPDSRKKALRALIDGDKDRENGASEISESDGD